MKQAQDKDNVPRHVLRRQREKEHRYRTILKAAETLFAKKGYTETSIEEIAQSAEVSPGTVYFYFSNKEDLLVNLLKDIGFQLRQLLGSVYGNAQSANEGVEKVGMAFFKEFCLRHPEKLTIFFREAAGKGALVEKQRKIVYDLITADIKNAVIQISDAFGKDERAKLTAEVISVCIVGVYEQLACNYLLWSENPPDMMKIAEDAVALISGGIRNLVQRST